MIQELLGMEFLEGCGCYVPNVTIAWCQDYTEANGTIYIVAEVLVGIERSIRIFIEDDHYYRGVEATIRTVYKLGESKRQDYRKDFLEGKQVILQLLYSKDCQAEVPSHNNFKGGILIGGLLNIVNNDITIRMDKCDYRLWRPNVQVSRWYYSKEIDCDQVLKEYRKVLSDQGYKNQINPSAPTTVLNPNTPPSEGTSSDSSASLSSSEELTVGTCKDCRSGDHAMMLDFCESSFVLKLKLNTIETLQDSPALYQIYTVTVTDIYKIEKNAGVVENQTVTLLLYDTGKCRRRLERDPVAVVAGQITERSDGSPALNVTSCSLRRWRKQHDVAEKLKTLLNEAVCKAAKT
ncbi:unnamed protein product [Cylicocyclus nassatus]|uniref:NTR domain-containing protein n=1 Tax=Cylicocyclus nassatus TaxID=53992 RepID=A0AA36GXJ4_CYLNA|nr:unnamed protein product [Cylicocyclus nassatus]